MLFKLRGFEIMPNSTVACSRREKSRAVSRGQRE
jgi:hypothetical protein